MFSRIENFLSSFLFPFFFKNFICFLKFEQIVISLIAFFNGVMLYSFLLTTFNLSNFLTVKRYSFSFTINQFLFSSELISLEFIHFYFNIFFILIFFFILKNIILFPVNIYIIDYFTTRLSIWEATHPFQVFRNFSDVSNYGTFFWKLFCLFFKQILFKNQKFLIFEMSQNIMLSFIVAVNAAINFYLINFLKFTSSVNFWFFDLSTKIHLTSTINLPWISAKFEWFNIGFIFDGLTINMLLVVLLISSFVHFYSIDYMWNDPRLVIFMWYLSGFTLAMLVLILADNYALLFLGWEGVGIFSYLLIGFWYTWTLALKASLKAVIINKIGDLAFLIAMSLCLFFFGTVNIQKLQIIILSLLNNFNYDLYLNCFLFEIPVINIISFFFLVGAIGKSAQIGLHTWLPDAMEGPTPVSALIHAATMVTAGVFLLVWSSFLFECSEFSRDIIILVGGLTALYGSLVACFQYDIKKIIAFSTCSQIGYMFLCCGLSAYHVAMFHLTTHACFKALLFLCAGSIIHLTNDQQDVWKMGGVIKFIPVTGAGLIIGLFSLMGLPFTSGFYSKDSIIEIAYGTHTLFGYFGFVCSLVAVFFTAFYCYWIFFYVFIQDTNLSWVVLQNVAENTIFIKNILGCLTIITIFIGILFKQPLSSPFAVLIYYNFIYFDFNNFILSDLELYIHHFSFLKFFLFITPFFGITTSWLYHKTWDNSIFFYYFEKKIKKLTIFSKLISILLIYQKIWYCFQLKIAFDYLQNYLATLIYIRGIYSAINVSLDRGWFELIFIKSIAKVCISVSKWLNKNVDTLENILYICISFIIVVFFLLFIKYEKIY